MGFVSFSVTFFFIFGFGSNFVLLRKRYGRLGVFPPILWGEKEWGLLEVGLWLGAGE